MPPAEGCGVAVQVKGVELEPVERFVIMRIQQPAVADDVEAQERRGSPQVDQIETLRTEHALKIGPELVGGLILCQESEVDISWRWIVGRQGAEQIGEPDAALLEQGGQPGEARAEVVGQVCEPFPALRVGHALQYTDGAEMRETVKSAAPTDPERAEADGTEASRLAAETPVEASP